MTKNLVPYCIIVVGPVGFEPTICGTNVYFYSEPWSDIVAALKHRDLGW